MVIKKILMIKLVISIFMLVAIIVASLPAFLWQIKSDITMEIDVIDKTVPSLDYNEHKGFFWILNNYKIKNTVTKQYYDYSKDYFGYFPNPQGYKIRYFKEIKNQPDIIYIMDTLGISKKDELMEAKAKIGEFENSKVKKAFTPSEIVYGGFDSEDLYQLQKYLKNNMTLIGEYNLFPSLDKSVEKSHLEDIFGIKNTGWRGKYFDSLDGNKGISEEFLKLYEEQYKKTWDFKKSGIIMISPNNKIIVLENGDCLKEEGLEFYFDENSQKEFSSYDNVNFSNWFEIVKPQNKSVVNANFKINVTEKGMEILKEWNLPDIFPAVIMKKENEYLSYYFAGDFGKTNFEQGTFNLWGIDLINKFMSNFDSGNNKQFYWKCYVPIINKIIDNAKADKRKKKNYGTLNPDEKSGMKYTARIEKGSFQMFINNEWKDSFIKGVNLGVNSIPGSIDGERYPDEALYYKWFEQISQMNSNAIRVNNLQRPEFYNALYDYNSICSEEKKLRFIQFTSPTNIPLLSNYLDNKNLDGYKKEIRELVNAIHGEGKGKYIKDVSSYLIAYQFGYNIDNEMITKINEVNKGFVHNGRHISAQNGSPAENWLALGCDYTMGYESDNYKWKHLMSVASNNGKYINTNNFDLGASNQVGFFSSISTFAKDLDPKYSESGIDGFLQAFKKWNKKYPILVTEFGYATGSSSSAYTEEEQGDKLVETFEVIKKEGYIGGMIFEWNNEWANRSFERGAYMIPFSRRSLWHNLIEPGQNFGIIGNDEEMDKVWVGKIEDTDLIKEVSIFVDSSFLYLDFKINKVQELLKENKIYLGIDIHHSALGQKRYAEELSLPAPTGIEFVMEIDKDCSLLKITPDYNIAHLKYSSKERDDGIFDLVDYLNIGDFGNLKNLVNPLADSLKIRIPWNMLNFSDPSTGRIIQDSRESSNFPKIDELKTLMTDGIVLTAVLADKNTHEVKDIFPGKDTFLTQKFMWKEWNEVSFHERTKKSYNILKDYFGKK